jgi:hypothetical protein
LAVSVGITRALSAYPVIDGAAFANQSGARQTLLMCICANSDPFSLACALKNMRAELRQLAAIGRECKTGSNFHPAGARSSFAHTG